MTFINHHYHHRERLGRIVLPLFFFLSGEDFFQHQIGRVEDDSPRDHGCRRLPAEGREVVAMWKKRPMAKVEHTCRIQFRKERRRKDGQRLLPNPPTNSKCERW